MPVARVDPRSLAVVLSAWLLPLAAAGAGVEPLRTASPGDTAAVAPVAGACPTFSWSAVAGASGYEIVVAELDPAGEPGPVRLRRTLDGSGLGSWTPALADCLEAGAAYVWSARALDPEAGEAAPGWSAPRRFAIDAAPSAEEIDAALAVLARARTRVADSRRGPRGTGGSLRADASAARGRSGGSAFGAEPASAAVRGETSAASGAGVLGVASTTSGDGWGVYGATDSFTGAGVFGRASDDGGYGVRGENDASFGAGVFGALRATDGGGSGVRGEVYNSLGYGVYARNYSTAGPARGVYGENEASNATAVSGYASGTIGQNYGVRGDARSSGGYGVLGLSAGVAGGGGTGVGGESQSTGGKGVFARSTATTSATYGLWAEVSSIQGTAVRGLARATTGSAHGVLGETDSTQGRGIYGIAPNTTGAYAGYFSGRVQVTGNLSKGGGSFKIDHPLDPENRYLYHSFVESPDMKNVYDGVVALDANGSGWVELPDWFEALNRDFRYQLTAVGAPSMVWIGREIEGGRFEVRGAPGARVSWQVTGIRKDPYAERHRIPVEEAKPESEIGTYLHPDAWGVDPRLGLDARERGTDDPPAPIPVSLPEAADAIR